MGILKKLISTYEPKITKYPSSSTISSDMKRLGISNENKAKENRTKEYKLESIFDLLDKPIVQRK
jgi:hypothetical protein